MPSIQSQDDSRETEVLRQYDESEIDEMDLHFTPMSAESKKRSSEEHTRIKHRHRVQGMKDLLKQIKADTDGLGAYLVNDIHNDEAKIAELVNLGYIDITDPTAITITPEGREFLGERTECVNCRYNSWLYDKKAPPPEPCNMFKIKVARTLTGCNQGAWK